MMSKELTTFEVGKTYRARFNVYADYKIHVMYVLDSIYEGEKLIIYRYYGKTKQWWHQEMKTAESLSMYIY